MSNSSWVLEKNITENLKWKNDITNYMNGFKKKKIELAKDINAFFTDKKISFDTLKNPSHIADPLLKNLIDKLSDYTQKCLIFNVAFGLNAKTILNEKDYDFLNDPSKNLNDKITYMANFGADADNGIDTNLAESEKNILKSIRKNYFLEIIKNLSLPMWRDKHINGDAILESTNPVVIPGTNDIPYVYISNTLTEATGDGNNIRVLQSGTGTGKSVVITTILFDSGNTCLSKNGDTPPKPVFKNKKYISIDSAGVETVNKPPTPEPSSKTIKNYRFLKPKKILILQPRQINVRENASYVAKLYGGEPGGLVGYKYKGNDVVSKYTHIIFMTQETFVINFISAFNEDRINGKLKKNNSDKIVKFLNKYRSVILDEAHEKTTVNELIVYIFKHYAKYSPDTTFVILSATIQPIDYTNYFYNENKSETEAKNYDKIVVVSAAPSGIRLIDYLQEPCENFIDTGCRIVETILNGTLKTDGYIDEADAQVIAKDGTIDHLVDAASKDILIFIAGAAERNAFEEKIKKILAKDPKHESIVIYGIYREQDAESEEFIKLDFNNPVDVTKMSTKHGKTIDRRILIGTNKAETGITYANLKYVIDTGFANTSYYNPDTDLTILLPTGISKNNMHQRFGRVGRKVGEPGFIFPLYTLEMAKKLPKNDHSKLLIEDYKKYYSFMMALRKNEVDSTDHNVMMLDLMVKNLSWKTVMNMNILYKTYDIINKHTNEINEINLKLFTEFGDYEPWKINLLINGWKSSCLNEMLIFVISDEMSMKLTNHMIEFNKSLHPNLRFLGTILPKIFYLKYHLDKNNKSGDDHMHDTILEKTDSEFSIQSFIKQFNDAREKLAKLHIINSIISDPTGTGKPIVNDVKWKATQSSADWEVLYRCISLSLKNNIGMSLSKEEYDNVNFYRLLNNPNVYGMINVDSVKLFQNEMPLMRKIKYTKLNYVKNLGGEIVDFIAVAGSPA